MRAAAAGWLVLAAAFPAVAQEAPAPAPTPVEASRVEQGRQITAVVRRLAREQNEAALKAFRERDYPTALAGFQAARALDPESAEITNNLAYLFQLLGNEAEAERFYGETLARDPGRAVAHLNLSYLLSRPGASQERLAEATVHASRARELRGNSPEIILHQARLAARRGLFDEAERLYREAAKAGASGPRFWLETADFYRDFGREDEAVVRLRRVPSEGEGSAEAAQRLWDIERTRQARRFGWSPQVEAIDPQAKVLAAKGRILASQGQHEEAERLLRQAIELAPAFAAARADLGDVLRAGGRTGEAELAYLQAVALDGGNADFYARLGRVYLEQGGRPRAPEAALLLGRALELKPDWTSLHKPLAHAYREIGNLAEALRHLEAYLGTPLGEVEREQALALRAALRERLPGQAEPMGGVPSAGGAGEFGAGRLGRIRAHLVQGELDAAMAVLDEIPQEQRTDEVRELEARILRAGGHLTEAEQVLRRVLEGNDAHPAAEHLLGLVLMELGRRAEAGPHLERARALGEAAAVCDLVTLRVGDDSGALVAVRDLARLPALLESRRDLEAFSRSGPGGAESERATALLATIDGRLRGTLGVVTLLGALLVAVGAWGWQRRFGGADLAGLIDTHPEQGPEVQAVLSAIRHEVLKHNTLALRGLIDAVERDEPLVGDKASFLLRCLEGSPGGEPVVCRLEGYADQLRLAGRAAGVRLNLERRDPALGAMLRGFGILGRLGPRLAGLEGLGPRQRMRVLRDLQRASDLLNRQGFEALQGLFERLRSVTVDEALLQAVFARVRREPAFAGAAIGEPAVEVQGPGGIGVVIPRRAWEDILGNLVRNALQASLEVDGIPVAIRLSVAVETDAITGLERVVTGVSDRSPRMLDREIIRDQAPERGLGLVRELVERFDGTLGVVEGPSGWSKTVTVRLPRSHRQAAPQGSGA